MYLSLLLLSFRFATSSNSSDPDVYCIIPFSVEKCLTYLFHGYVGCRVDPASRQREFTCTHPQLPFMLSTTDFSILHPPFLGLLLSFYRNDHIRLQVGHHDLEDTRLEFDLRHLSDSTRLAEVTMLILVDQYTDNMVLIFHWPFILLAELVQATPVDYSITVKLLSSPNSTVRDRTLCDYIFWNLTNQDQRLLDHRMEPCPSETCAESSSDFRLCIGSHRCMQSGKYSFSCRIDRLRSDDRFTHTGVPRLSYLTITTNDPGRNTQHVFSEHLVRACIARHLVVVVIDGRLQIPSMNVSVFTCADGTVRGAKKLWK